MDQLYTTHQIILHLNPEFAEKPPMYLRQKDSICDRIYAAVRRSPLPLTIHGICEEAGCYKFLAKFAIIDLVEEGFLQCADVVVGHMAFAAVELDNIKVHPFMEYKSRAAAH